MNCISIQCEDSADLIHMVISSSQITDLLIIASFCSNLAFQTSLPYCSLPLT